MVRIRRRDHRQRDAGVAAGRFDDDASRLQVPRPFGGVDHGKPDAVLDAVGWVIRFQLGGDLRLRPCRDPVQAHERSVADQFGYVVCDFHSILLFLNSLLTLLPHPVFLDGEAGKGLQPGNKKTARSACEQFPLAGLCRPSSVGFFQ
jgi:hypothetical protein